MRSRPSEHAAPLRAAHLANRPLEQLASPLRTVARAPAHHRGQTARERQAARQLAELAEATQSCLTRRPRRSIRSDHGPHRHPQARQQGAIAPVACPGAWARSRCSRRTILRGCQRTLKFNRDEPYPPDSSSVWCALSLHALAHRDRTTNGRWFGRRGGSWAIASSRRSMPVAARRRRHPQAHDRPLKARTRAQQALRLPILAGGASPKPSLWLRTRRGVVLDARKHW